ncbi:MAG: recombinase family protein [Clostridia bacterium]|nr:recombinase family protein [Clostridia bacterium]
MQYCIYLRKSRADMEAEARGEGETLARHEKILTDLTHKMNIYISNEAIYKEIVSGETIASRPVMQQLLSEVEKGVWNGVFVVEVERLARGDTVDQGIVAQTFKYSSTKIITPMKTYDPDNEFDEEYFEFGLFMSRREYKTINRRLESGRISSTKEGKYVGNIPPYGYIRKKLEKEKGYTLTPHPEQAPVVKSIFEWYTKGELQPNGTYKRLGVSLIARKLNDLRIPTIKGGDWVVSTIRGILSNPVYIGKIRRGFRPQVKKMVSGKMTKQRPRANKDTWILVKGLHEAIIDEETFDLAQKFLSLNLSTPAPSQLGVKNPLAGLIVCGVCGRKMVRRPYNSRTQSDTLMCAVTSCNNVSSRLSLVEDKLLQVLEAWLNEYKLNIKAESNNEQQDYLEIDLIKKSMEQLDKEIATLEKQSDNLHDLLEQGVYTKETFFKRSNVLNEKSIAAVNNKIELEKRLKDISNKREAIKIIIPKVEKTIEVYHYLDTPAEKNELLKEILEKVTYNKTIDGRCKKWRDHPDDFELILYPKLPK